MKTYCNLVFVGMSPVSSSVLSRPRISSHPARVFSGFLWADPGGDQTDLSCPRIRQASSGPAPSFLIFLPHDALVVDEDFGLRLTVPARRRLG